MDRRHFLAAAGAASTTLALPAYAQAKPIRIIVPFAAGGAIDVTARLIAEKASRHAGQPS
jgi:tripartite-type tricarboxylate transporter receptor subunit TctC